MEIRTRIAPSPTGDPHVGTAYMALFNMAIAHHNNGKFILRIEDTDQSRSKPKYEENIFNSLKWCGLQWDEGPDIGGAYGPYRQSERFDIYKKYCDILLEKGKAYKCFATPEELAEMREINAKSGKKQGYDRRYRNLSADEIKEREHAGQPYVVRLKVPLTRTCSYNDAIKGKCSCPWADVDDQILLKSDGFPTYHLANVVDDHLMKITHVIRGDEWLPSTPKHVLLYEYFGWEAPIFMHMPLLLNKDGKKKLSKRKNPTSIFFYRDSGYLPEAFLNFLSLMGYSMPKDKEIYSIKEFIETFDEKRIGTSGAVFDINKLDWINQQYIINNISENDLWSRIQEWRFNEQFMQKLMPLCHTRIKTFGDFIDLFDFIFTNNLKYSEELLCPKNLTAEQACYIIQAIIWELEKVDDWSGKFINQTSRLIAEKFKVNHKKIIMPILFSSLMGKRQGPPLFDSADILGKDRTRARLLATIEFLGGISNKKMKALENAAKKDSFSQLLDP